MANRTRDTNKTTWARTLNDPRGEEILRYIGWEEYVVNLKRPYPGCEKTPESEVEDALKAVSP
jgi:hypothetical protein